MYLVYAVHATILSAILCVPAVPRPNLGSLLDIQLLLWKARIPCSTRDAKPSRVRYAEQSLLTTSGMRVSVTGITDGKM